MFVAHTARDRVEVIDHDTSRHVATLEGFPEAAGVVAHDGNVLVTNRGAASLAWLDAATLADTLGVSDGAAAERRRDHVARRSSAIAACIGDAAHGPELQAFELATGRRTTLALPGRPRWCVVSADDTRVFLAIRDPSMVLAARIPGPQRRAALAAARPAARTASTSIMPGTPSTWRATTARWSRVGHGSGKATAQWPLAGGPDATFFNPASGLVHVAIADPGSSKRSIRAPAPPDTDR